MVSGYIENDNCDINQVRYQLLKEGRASGFWWAIWYEEIESDEESEMEKASDDAQETLCYLYEDSD